MVDRANSKKSDNANALSLSEEQDIEYKIKFELQESQFKMVKLGGISNTLAAIFAAWILYSHTKLLPLIIWLAALICANGVNIAFSIYYKYRHIPLDKLKPWIKAYHIILAILSLIWGGIGILSTSYELNYQIFTVAFLLIAVVGFGFGTITDFTAAIISISCLLLPYISYNIYLGIHSLLFTGYDPNLNLAFSIIMFIIGTFLLMICYVGSRLIKKFFRLSFINVALSQKLETANKFLEERVQERTVELEDSLKLITHQATHDLLTDLPNRSLLVDRIQQVIVNAKRMKKLVAILFLDLDRFKAINDSVGHNIGDALLNAVAPRLLTCVRETDTVARVGGDEFVIVLPGLEKAEDAIAAAQKILAAITQPFQIKDREMNITTSIGISFYPIDANDVNTLLRNSDLAMYQAKELGRNNFQFYTADMNKRLAQRIALEEGLHGALERNEFHLHYQPLVELKTHKIIGAEALLRWQSPTLGSVPPLDFIHLAEELGLIISIGEWVLHTACKQTQLWQTQGLPPIQISINLSGRQLKQPDIVDIVSSALKESGLNPDLLELELTESILIDNVEKSLQTLNQLKGLGIHLVIDDFGTGYSSLSYLKRFPVDKLKIDKSFIDDITLNPNDAVIAIAIIAMAKSLKMRVLAEGVETANQLEFLRQYDCDEIQGYYFSKPVDTTAFTELLEKGIIN